MEVPAKEQHTYIQKYLEGNNNSLKTNLEIIGNLLVGIGINYIDHVPPAGTGNDQLITLALADREQHGETLGNATLLQGLTILCWLGD